MGNDKCKLGKLYSDCEKFQTCKQQNPNSIITCSSRLERTPEGNKIGYCDVIPTKEFHDEYHDVSRRSDGGIIIKHSNTI